MGKGFAPPREGVIPPRDEAMTKTTSRATCRSDAVEDVDDAWSGGSRIGRVTFREFRVVDSSGQSAGRNELRYALR
jgi:hypothetical protein